MVIFDCNGVLVDSETIVASVLAEALRRVGLWITSETAMRSFHGRRPADVFAAIERAAGIEPLPFPVQNSLTRTMRSAGKADYQSLWAGQGVSRCQAKPAAELVRSLL